MKRILKITGMLLVGISMLNAAECTSEKKAQMIMNGIEQSVIDEICSPKAKSTAQQPVQVIINNSSSADNTNTNTDTNTIDAASEHKNYVDDDSISRDRLYIAINTGSGSGEYTKDNYYTTETYEINGNVISLSLGYVFDSNNRFEIASSSVEIDELDRLTIDGIDFNWIWTMGSKKVKSGSMRPYLLLGFSSYTLTNPYYYNDSEEGVGFNFGLGVMYPLGDSLELDLGYHARSIVWDVYDYYGDSETRTISLTNLNLSLRLKF